MSEKNLGSSGRICLHQIFSMGVVDKFFSAHALISGGQALEILHTPPTRRGERHEAGDEAWRATKALLFGGGFLQRGGNSEPWPTQAVFTCSFVKSSPGQ